MFGASRKFSVIVAPFGSTKSWNRVFSLPALLGIAVAVGVFIGLFFVLVVQVAELGSRVGETVALREENAQLRSEMTRIEELEIELTRLRELETRVRHWAGVEVESASPASAPPRSGWRWEREEELLAGVPRLLPVDGWISRGFEVGLEGHSGIDYAGETGAPIRASARGVVRFVGWDDDLGHLVVLDHGNGFSTSYGHNDSLLVEMGEIVPEGHPIARLGSTGRSSAPHLHFEVRLGDEALDPAYFLTMES